MLPVVPTVRQYVDQKPTRFDRVYASIDVGTVADDLNHTIEAGDTMWGLAAERLPIHDHPAAHTWVLMRKT